MELRKIKTLKISENIIGFFPATKLEVIWDVLRFGNLCW